MDELGALGLDPAEPPAERCLDFALHRVGLVARHPPPPLHLRVAEAPRRPRPSAAAAPGGYRQRRRRRPGGRLDDDVEAPVAVRHDLVAVGAVVLTGGGEGGARVGAVRAVVVGGGHREARARRRGGRLRGESRGVAFVERERETPLPFPFCFYFFCFGVALARVATCEPVSFLEHL